MEPDFIDNIDLYVPGIDPENLIDLEDEDDGDANLCGDVQLNGSCIELEQLQDVQSEDAKQLWDPGMNVGQHVSRRRGKGFEMVRVQASP